MSVVEEIKSRLDIVEIISTYVPLKKAGRTFKGLCPFHAEKTPSFVVFPDNQSWHCFGSCGTGGDVFSFVMQKEKLDFPETLQLLAQRAGVALTPRGEEASPEEERRERLRQAVREAAMFFHQQLLDAPAAAHARAYVDQRGLNHETVVQFQLGFAPNEWEALKRHLFELGYAADVLLEAGLMIHNDERNRDYDRFRNRLIIPISDVQGRVIGFGARALDDSLPKYLNSPQTPLFDKSSVLFALDQARRPIRDADQAVIVEGYMDVLAAHQHGARNVVASMGTALTETQFRTLKRYTSNFVLALDADDAGNHATLRGLQLARQALDKETVSVPTATGLVRQESKLAVNLRVMSLPTGLDPDDLIRRDVAQWHALVQASAPLVDFLFGVVAQEQDLNSAKGKAAAVRELAPLVQEIADSMERAHYIQRLARLVRVDERTVQRELDRLSGANQNLASSRALPTRRKERALPETKPTLGLAEYALLQALLHPNLVSRADRVLSELGFEPLQPTDFSRTEQRSLLEALRAAEMRQEISGEPALDEFPPFLDTYVQELNALSFAPPLGPEQAIQDFVNTVLRLRQSNLQQRLQELRHLQAENSSELADSSDLNNPYRALVRTHLQELGRLQLTLSRRNLLTQSA